MFYKSAVSQYGSGVVLSTIRDCLYTRLDLDLNIRLTATVDIPLQLEVWPSGMFNSIM